MSTFPALSRQDAFYLSRVVLKRDDLPYEDLDAHPFLKALVSAGVITSADDILQRLGLDALKAVLAEDPATPPTRAAESIHEVDVPALPAKAEPRAEDREAGRETGRWWQAYGEWASRTANESPECYHEATGLWVAGLAIARRVFISTTWGERIYPNLYVMLLGETTVHRKSTAYNLAVEQIVLKAIPHMRLPTPGSAEQFTKTLAGRMPENFAELSPDDKTRLLAGRAFAAQRGLVWDELAGLFGSAKRDFMAGLKQLLLELYGCPSLKEWETGKHGRTILRNGALYILGATTPADLLTVLGDENWRDGLLARFVIVMPDSGDVDRPALEYPDMATRDALAARLKCIHEALPTLEVSEDPTASLRAEDVSRPLPFAAWAEARAYSKALRNLCRPAAGLDERLKGFYGRLHVLALKVSLILTVIDWAESGQLDQLPMVTRAHWARAWEIAEGWRASLHRVLDALDVTLDARQEMNDDRKVVFILRQYGHVGCSGRELGKFARIGSKRLSAAIQRLIDGGEAQAIDPPTGSKTQSWYVAN